MILPNLDEQWHQSFSQLFPGPTIELESQVFGLVLWNYLARVPNLKWRFVNQQIAMQHAHNSKIYFPIP